MAALADAHVEQSAKPIALAHPAPPAPVEFHYTQTESFVALLHELGASLLVTTYQANKLLAARASGNGLSTLVRTFDRPMGLAVGRTKKGRRRGFTLDERWLGPARVIAEGFGLHYLSNIQFRMYEDQPVLLDVNTRPAGGLHQLSLCGVNAPWAAVQLALGEDPGVIEPPFLGQDYAVVSGPKPVLPSVPVQREEADVVLAPTLPVEVESVDAAAAVLPL